MLTKENLDYIFYTNFIFEVIHTDFWQTLHFVVKGTRWVSLQLQSIHPLPFVMGGGGGETLTKFSKSRGGGGLTGPVFRGGLLGKRGVTFFRGGGFQFLDKKQTKI